MIRDKEQPQDICPLQGIIRSSPRAGEKGQSPVLRIKRWLKRRLSIKSQKRIKDAARSPFDWLDRLRGRGKKPNFVQGVAPSQRLNAGDWVRVRSREEIQATLDHWRSLKGLAFLDEMAVYCGTSQRVLKRVERFMDERDYRLKKASGVVLLEGLICSGTGSTGRCDRACFFFWREEWLEKLAGPEGPHT